MKLNTMRLNVLIYQIGKVRSTLYFVYRDDQVLINKWHKLWASGREVGHKNEAALVDCF